MKNPYSFLTCLVLIMMTIPVFSQVSSDYAVMLTATIDTVTPAITLKWTSDPLASGFTVSRKAKTSPTWDLTLAALSGTDSTYTDNTVVIDSAYEYRVRKTAPSLNAFGYLCAGIQLHATDYRGKVILLVDNSLSGNLSQEIGRLMMDISGDGWSLTRYDLSPSVSVTDVKSIIAAEYYSDPGNVKCLFILGHIPVPYSGDINPDGHPDHLGAWPADVYYGDLTGNYTDAYVNDTNASRPENHNVPGDGKFDQNLVAGIMSLEVGRVDLHNMPAFPQTESDLIKKYLDKDHAFRTKQISVHSRGLIDDHFGAFGGEAFAANGWRNFPPLVGRQNVQEKPFFATLDRESYLWSYACGGGWYQGASGVGTTTDFVNDTVLSVFSMLFGSYFGDWDNADNFLRAPLASTGYLLTCCWAGRPNWQFHHMALGENIGYCARLSQNNQVTYLSGYGQKFVHVALMGDPTLRMHIIASPVNVSASVQNQVVTVNWQLSPDTVLGYYVYRSQQRFGYYSRISPQIIAGLTFSDPLPPGGINYYMVKALTLQFTPSGSYYNLSTGIADSVMVYTSMADLSTKPLPVILLYPVPANDRVNFESDMDLPAGCRVSIMDPTGRIISEQDFSRIIQYRSYPIPVDRLSPGLYLLTVKFAGGTISKKLEISR